MASTDRLPPSYITKEFLQEVLQNKLSDQKFEIVSCDMKSALAPGENYVSIIFRTNITIQKCNGKRKDISLIMKSIPPSVLMQEHIHTFQFFLKEAQILSDYIPTMLKLFPTTTRKFSAKCHYFQGPPNDLIIMEDLRDLGYVLGDRKNGLDLQHTLLVVKSLAGYHAGMRTLTKKRPELIEEFKDSFWDEAHSDRNEKFMIGAAQYLADNAGKWEGFPQSLIPKLQKLVLEIKEKEYQLWKINKNCKVNTLLHGDCWVNNMMFKYDSTGKVNELVFLDFQLASYCSALIDLHYFLFTSVNLQVRKEHLETVKRTFYEELTSILNETDPGLDFTYDEFEEEYRNNLFHGLVSLVTVYPITGGEETADVDNLFDKNDEEFKNAYLFKNRRIQEFLIESFIYFDDNGVL